MTKHLTLLGHRMTRIFTILLFIGLAWGQTNQVPSIQVVMDSAYKAAKNEDRHVLLIFHTSWCDYCKLLIDGLTNNESKIFFDENFIITTINPFGEKANAGAMKYFEELLDNNEKGYPSTFIIDENRKKLDYYYGYPNSKTKIDSLTSILKKYSRFDNEQNELYLDILSEYFINNK